MIDLDEALASLTEVAARFDEPVAAIITRAGRRVRRRRVVRAVGAVVVVAITVVGIVAVVDAGRPRTSVIVDTPPTRRPSARTPGAFAFRLVLGQIPYGPGGSSLPPSSGINNVTSCEGGRLVTPPSNQTARTQAVLADRTKTTCYVLGPALLTGTAVAFAQASFNQTSSSWDVDLRFATDAFVTKVATPYVGRQIAMVFDGVVESAPTINPGITGRDVTISSTFDEATAREIAAAIAPAP